VQLGKRIFLAAALAGAGVSLTAGSAAAADLHCGSVVTKSVTLHKDILGCTGNGLVVGPRQT